MTETLTNKPLEVTITTTNSVLSDDDGDTDCSSTRSTPVKDVNERISNDRILLEQMEILSNRKKKKWQNLMQFYDNKDDTNKNDTDRPNLVNLTPSSSAEDNNNNNNNNNHPDDTNDDALSTATPLSLAETEASQMLWHQEHMDEMERLYDEIGSEVHTFDRLESEFVADLNELSQGLEQAFQELYLEDDGKVMEAVDVEGLRQTSSSLSPSREKAATAAPVTPTATQESPPTNAARPLPKRTFSSWYSEALENQRSMNRGFKLFWEQLSQQWDQFWDDLVRQLKGKRKDQNNLLAMAEGGGAPM